MVPVSLHQMYKFSFLLMEPHTELESHFLRHFSCRDTPSGMWDAAKGFLARHLLSHATVRALTHSYVFGENLRVWSK